MIGILGKVVACFLGAWASGMKPREEAALGSLLNMRGLICLIVLNIGIDFKVLNTTVFSMMVIMAVVNTLLTTPLFAFFCSGTSSVSVSNQRSSGVPASVN